MRPVSGVTAAGGEPEATASRVEAPLAAAWLAVIAGAVWSMRRGRR
jgi:hypothetical protein